MGHIIHLYPAPMEKPVHKPTLMQVRHAYNKQFGAWITAQDIALRAGVNPGTEYAMELGSYVSPEDVDKIICAWNQMTGGRYQRDDFFVLISGESQCLP